LWHAGADRSRFATSALLSLGEIGRPDEQTEIGGIDRRRFDAHEDLVILRLVDGSAFE
jgi:hypothetical protein